MARYRPDAPSITGAPAAPKAPHSGPSAWARAVAAAHPPTALIAPTLAGPWHLDVGARSYAIPEGSEVVHAEHDAIAYVLTPQGGLHVLSERGELTDVRPDILAAIRQRFSADP